MHRPIQDGLEDYLGGRAGAAKLRAFHEHLAACTDCRTEVEALAAQSQLLQNLRAPTVDPAPGFYARVIERIEAQRVNSFWSVFLEPVMARRIVYASLCLLVLLGSAVVSTGPMQSGPAAATTPVALMADESMPAADGSDIHHDRTVVLTTLTSFGGPAGADFLPTSSD